MDNDLPIVEVKKMLPGIEEYLMDVLGKEKLSAAAEAKRKYYVGRLEVLALPPALPPRPGQGPFGPNVDTTSNTNGGNEHDVIARQRELSRASLMETKGAQHLLNNNQEDYDPVGEPNGYHDDSGDFYEEPEMNGLNNDVPHTNSVNQEEDGEDSGTPYESYSEDEFTDDELYENEFTPNNKQEEIQLPRVRSVKKKKKGVSELKNKIYSGILFQKHALLNKLVKHYCAISDEKLMCFKNEKDKKAAVTVQLPGYDATYLEREGKYSNVIRLSRPGFETHWFSADSKDQAHEWVDFLNAIANGAEPPSVEKSSLKRTPSDVSSNSQHPSLQKSSSLSDVSAQASGSEGGSGDGTVKQVTKETPEKKSTLLGRLGRMLGGDKSKTSNKKSSEFEEPHHDLTGEVTKEGYVNVMSDWIQGGKKWLKRWMVVRNNTLECYKSSDLDAHDFCMALSGVNLSICKEETKKDLAIKLVEKGETKIFIEPPDTIEHGNWVNVLIKEAQKGVSPSARPCHLGDHGVEERPSHIGDHGLEEDEELYEQLDDHIEAHRASHPPPLPTAPVPTARLKQADENDNEDYYDDTNLTNSYMEMQKRHQMEDEDIYELPASVDEQDYVKCTNDGSAQEEEQAPPVKNVSRLSKLWEQGQQKKEQDKSPEKIEITKRTDHASHRRDPVSKSQSKQAKETREEPLMQVEKTMSNIKSNLERETVPSDERNGHKDKTAEGVVKCHTVGRAKGSLISRLHELEEHAQYKGPTILEDQEILESIRNKNSILNKLRHSKGTDKSSNWTSLVNDEEEEDIGHMNEDDLKAAITRTRKLKDEAIRPLRKLESEARRSALGAMQLTEKHKYEKEVSRYEKRLVEMNTRLAKLQQQASSERHRSMTKADLSPATSPVPSSRSTSRSSSVSDRETVTVTKGTYRWTPTQSSSSSSKLEKSATLDSSTHRNTPLNKAATLDSTTSGRSAFTGAFSTGKAKFESGNSSPATSIGKFDSSRSASHTPERRSSSGSTTSTSSLKQASPGQRKPARVTAESGAKASSKVQEKLKLFESINDSSNC